MGLIFGCECKKCGYQFSSLVGVGFLYPKEYSDTIEKMKNGFFGNQGKEFWEAFPDGAISCERIVVQCKDCGSLMAVPELSMYIPKDSFNPSTVERKVPWSTAFSGAGYNYVSFSELENHYELFEMYDHRCSKCNSNTIIVPGFTENMIDGIDRHVRCPGCGNILEIEIKGSWD